MLATKAYAAQNATSPLAPFEISRREPGPHDVLFDVLFCGICHSDIHFAHGEFPGQVFPAVPGHEIIGKVVKTGSAVTKHKVGDVIGVGCIVDSCRVCVDCECGEEHFCNSMVGTYGGTDKDGTPTFGGYSTRMTVDENYVLRIPKGLDPAATAPLLCAGITTYSPLRHWKVGKGSKVGVVGLGGLGHMAVKIAAAMDADVTVLSTSDKKRADAARLGAKDFAITRGETDTFTRLANHFDVIINTISAGGDNDAFVSLLKRDGTLVLLGMPEGPLSLNAFGLLMKRKAVAGSLIGGIRETQEMLDFCAEHGIVSDIEMTTIDKVNEAYDRVLKSDVRYRFVIDMASLK